MSRRNKIIIILAAVLLLALTALTAGAMYSVNTFANTDKIIAGAEFYGAEIGGKTKSQAIKIIKENEKLPVSLPVTVGCGEKTFTYSPNGSGIEYDVEAIVDNAFKIGREKSFFANLKDIAMPKKARKIKPVYKQNKEVFEQTIETLAEDSDIHFATFDVNVYERYADVKINGNKTIIDYDELLSVTYNIIEKSENRTITLPVKEVVVVSPQQSGQRL